MVSKIRAMRKCGPGCSGPRPDIRRISHSGTFSSVRGTCAARRSTPAAAGRGATPARRGCTRGCSWRVVELVARVEPGAAAVAVHARAESPEEGRDVVRRDPFLRGAVLEHDFAGQLVVPADGSVLRGDFAPVARAARSRASPICLTRVSCSVAFSCVVGCATENILTVRAHERTPHRAFATLGPVDEPADLGGRDMARVTRRGGWCGGALQFKTRDGCFGGRRAGRSGGVAATESAEPTPDRRSPAALRQWPS